MSDDKARVMVSLRLDAEQVAQIGRLAKELNQTRSEALRMLISEALDQAPPKAPVEASASVAPPFDHPFTMSAGNYQKCRCGVRELDHR
jgi:hypothetical protein